MFSEMLTLKHLATHGFLALPPNMGHTHLDWLQDLLAAHRLCVSTRCKL